MLPEIITSIPGPRSLAFAEKLRTYESRNVTYSDAEFPIFWKHAAGVNVWDADDNRFLDFTSAFGVAGLGHTNPHILENLVNQAPQLWHAMGDVHPTELKALLCEKLSNITFERWNSGTGKTILGNSGFEAVEAALKTALLYTGKAGVIAFTGAYHGLGYGALEASGIPFFKTPFRSQLKDFATLLPYPHCPHGTTDHGDFPECSHDCLSNLHQQFEDAIRKHQIGAVIVEPIQGRGGTVVPPKGFLPLLRKLCDKHGILLILDEIYTGFNRTGALFACEHSGVIPDLICLGKALTSGFPLSACVGKSGIMDAWPESTGEALHTSTFLGHPLGCRMALAAIETHLDPAIAIKVRETGAHFKSMLRKLNCPYIGNLRGAGLMIGAELLKTDGTPFPKLGTAILKQGLKDGLILLCDSPSGNVLAFAPPFMISGEEIDYLVKKLQEYLTSLPGSIS